MNRTVSCLFERMGYAAVGTALGFIGLTLVLSGVTVLPIIGFFMALPVFWLSVRFFRADRSPECML